MKRIEIDVETGQCLVVETTVVENPTPLLSKLVPTKTLALSITRDVVYVYEDGRGSDDNGLAVCRLRELNLGGSWFLETAAGGEDSPGVLYPFIKPDTGTSVAIGSRKDLAWTPPDNLEVLLVVEFSGNTSKDGVDAASPKYITKSTLLFVDDDGITRQPPLPNTYNDGSLCTGLLNDITRCRGVMECTESVLSSWSSNAWNTDLSGGSYEWKQIILRDAFSFDPVTLKQVVPGNLWVYDCPTMGCVPGVSECLKKGCENAIKSILSSDK